MQGATNRPARSVLLIEDNQNDEDMEIRALKRAWPTLSIEVARDGEEAFEKLFGDPPSSLPHLILLDIKLPRRNGVEILTAIREDDRYRCVPVVMLTSSAELADIMNCYDLGANSFVQKAMDYTEFMQNIAICVEYWLRVNIAPQA